MESRAIAPLMAILLVLLAAPGSAARQSTLRIGSVEFFGTTGIDVAALRARLPVRAGDTIDRTRASDVMQKIRDAVQDVTHRAATDVNVMCCESSGRWTIYVGLAGANFRASTYRPTPTGSSCLPASVVELYTRAVDANMKAAEQGDAAEDDSRGYALAHNPALRQTQLAMRQFAVSNKDAIVTTLRDCSAHEPRRAASMLLGYADQSADQIAQLVQSATDADATVRNNALRALEVLASLTSPPEINADGLVDMLNSGTWTDRNKACSCGSPSDVVPGCSQRCPDARLTR